MRARVFAASAAAVTGIVLWAFSTTSTTAVPKVGFFAASALLIAGAFGRQRIGLALATIGVMSLALHTQRLETIDVWAVVFAGCTAAGTLVGLRSWSALRWIVASLPFWALGNASQVFMVIALVLSIGGLAVAGVAPTLPGRRVRRGEAPLPYLANGPLTPVAEAVYYGGQKSRRLTWLFVILAVVLAVVAARTPGDGTIGALALSSAIIAATFAASHWFATRVRLRIDDHGLHSRTLFGEQRIAWRDVAGLTLRYVWLPGYNLRVTYYVVFSPAREFAFASSMHGAAKLQAAIEQATGLRWPAPAFDATF